MNAKTNTAKPEEKESQSQLEKKKTCFVIMPIADMHGYDSGHFTRVYNHLIKPACEAAGFIPVRSDDVNSSHMIVVDILQKIVESDIAICDLSGRNPNVLYELGLRQAFNKKTVLIKDNKTDNIFDVQGFRYSPYDQALRIDNVNNETNKISNALKETFNATNDINSIVQLLQIEPAEIKGKTQLTEGDTFLLNSINELKSMIEANKKPSNGNYKKTGVSIGKSNLIVNEYYELNDEFFGIYLGLSHDNLFAYFKDMDDAIFTIPTASNLIKGLTILSI